MIDEAKAAGAEGINLLGMCCSGAEVLSRHGVPHTGNFMSTEAVLVTGAVDVQCIKQGLATLTECYDTKFFTTNPQAHIEGAMHIEFEEHHGIGTLRRETLLARAGFFFYCQELQLCGPS